MKLELLFTTLGPIAPKRNSTYLLTMRGKPVERSTMKKKVNSKQKGMKINPIFNFCRKCKQSGMAQHAVRAIY